jgi:hypothetical protein
MIESFFFFEIGPSDPIFVYKKDNNSIRIYLRANLTAQRPITKLARERSKKYYNSSRRKSSIRYNPKLKSIPSQSAIASSSLFKYYARSSPYSSNYPIPILVIPSYTHLGLPVFQGWFWCIMDTPYLTPITLWT